MLLAAGMFIAFVASGFLCTFEGTALLYTIEAKAARGNTDLNAVSADTDDFETETDTLVSYGMLPVYGKEIRDGEYSIRARTSDTAPAFESVKLTVSDGGMSAELTVENSACTQLRIDGAACTLLPDKDKRVYSVSVEALDQELDCEIYDAVAKEWKEYKILFEASSLPKEALLVELPDYDLIEKALSAYENSSEEKESSAAKTNSFTPVSIDLKDGEYSVSVDMEGGSGKAFVTSPTLLIVKDGKAYARLEWSSSNYDYMIVGTKKYLNAGGEDANSTFEIPIACWDGEMTAIADTTAMGTPHEVEYTLVFHKDSIGSKGALPQEAAKRVVIFAVLIIIVGGILNYIVKNRRAG